MTAASVAALTVYDMVKGLERGVAIEGVVLSPRAAAAPASGALDEPAAELMRAALLTVSTSKAARRGRGRERRARSPSSPAGSGSRSPPRRSSPTTAAGSTPACATSATTLGVDLVLTSGGTGLSPDDVTPEATRAVLEREAPGIAEAMRAASRPHSAHWMLSRGVAGTRGRTLIVNFPGSPRSIAQCGEALAAALPHALALLAGERPRPHLSRGTVYRWPSKTRTAG